MPWNSVDLSRQPRRGRRSIFIVGILVGLLAMPVAVWASHQFSDVPDSSPYHKNISALADAGVAGGYADGTYKPTELVSRQHMAAFLHRGLGRLAVITSLNTINVGASDALLGSVPFRSEGAVGGYQGILITVNTQMDHDTSVAAGCFVFLTAKKDGTVIGSWSQEFYPTANGEESSTTATYMTVQATQTVATYTIHGTSSCSVTTFTDSEMVTIQSFPFEGDGTGFSPASVVKSEEPRKEP